MKHIKNHILKGAKQIKHFVRPLNAPEKYRHEGVPYFCQWESRELAQAILEKSITTDEDPNWKRSGAKTKQEYHEWSWNGCGMACTKMILAHKTGKVVPLVGLGKKCEVYGGYQMPLETSPGLYYKPYTSFVSHEFGWKAKVVQGMLQSELIHELGKGNLVIAGVSKHIYDVHSRPKVKGGHLVLMVGYDRTKREFYLHNPSGTSKKTQEYAAISFDDFKKFFSGRGIVIQG